MEYVANASVAGTVRCRATLWQPIALSVKLTV